MSVGSAASPSRFQAWVPLALQNVRSCPFHAEAIISKCHSVICEWLFLAATEVHDTWVYCRLN